MRQSTFQQVRTVRINHNNYTLYIIECLHHKANWKNITIIAMNILRILIASNFCYSQTPRRRWDQGNTPLGSVSLRPSHTAAEPPGFRSRLPASAGSTLCVFSTLGLMNDSHGGRIQGGDQVQTETHKGQRILLRCTFCRGLPSPPLFSFRCFFLTLSFVFFLSKW